MSLRTSSDRILMDSQIAASPLSLYRFVVPTSLVHRMPALFRILR